MNFHEPSSEMNVIAAIERVQPYVSGVDEKGELIWEGRDMPRWQCKMFPIHYQGDFRNFWIKRAFYDATGVEINTPSMQLYGWKKSGAGTGD